MIFFFFFFGKPEDVGLTKDVVQEICIPCEYCWIF